MNAEGLGTRIDKFEDTFRALAEAGLFSNEPEVQPAGSPARVPPSDQIRESIRKARDLIDQKHLPDAATELTSAEVLLHREIYGRSRTWRLVRVYQVPIFLYYLLCLTVLAALALSPARSHLPSLWGVPSFVLGLGVLGAVLRGLYWLQVQVASRIFRAPFVLAHFAAPWIGLLLAVGSYLLVQGGLLTLQASSAPTASVTAVSHDYLVRIAAFLAGFNWTVFLDRLNRVFAGGGTNSSSPSPPK